MNIQMLEHLFMSYIQLQRQQWYIANYIFPSFLQYFIDHSWLAIAIADSYIT